MHSYNVSSQLLDYAGKEEISRLEGMIETRPTTETINFNINKIIERIIQMEVDNQKRKDSYVQMHSYEYDTNEIRQSILELQTNSFNSIDSLEEWRGSLEEDLDLIKVDLDNNVVRRDEWNKFVEHAEGFATGDITEQIMHDIRGSQSQIDKLVRDTKKIYSIQGNHEETLNKKAEKTELSALQEFNAITYATNDIVYIKTSKLKKAADETVNQVARNTRDIQTKAEKTEAEKQEDFILDIQDKLGDAMAELRDKAPIVDVSNLRLAMENIQHQITFIRNQIEGVKSISKKTSEMFEEANISMPIPTASNTMMAAHHMADKAHVANKKRQALQNTADVESKQITMPSIVVPLNDRQLSPSPITSDRLSPSPAQNQQILRDKEIQSSPVKIIKYQLQTAITQLNHLEGQHDRIEERLLKLKEEEENEKLKEAEHGRYNVKDSTDDLEKASLSNRIGQHEDKLLRAKKRLDDQKELIRTLQKQVEQAALMSLGRVSDDMKSNNLTDNTKKSIEKATKLNQKQQNLKENTTEVVDTQQQYNMNMYQEEQNFPAAGVRCLFCDHPAKRISKHVGPSNRKNVVIARKSGQQKQPQPFRRRPQTARERSSRLSYNITANDNNPNNQRRSINIKVLDGVVAPPPIRQSFRVSALVPKNIVKKSSNNYANEKAIAGSSKVEGDKK